MRHSLLLLFCCCLTLLGGCQYDLAQSAAASKDFVMAATLTQEGAVKLGKQSAEQYDKENTVAPAGNAYAKRLATITRNLRNEGGLQLNFAVYLTKDVNAFALPDGSIRVYSGLMDMMNDEELLFIVGHEIGHVKNLDSYDRFRMVYLTSGARKALAAVGGTIGQLSSSQLGALAHSFVNAQHSQKQEYAADEYGFGLLKRSQKNQAAAISSLRKLATLGDTGSILSSHPQSSKRAARLEGML